MGKPTICLGENKDADQLRGNREADQRLCLRYSDSTIPPLLNSKISSFKPASVAVQVGLCRTCSDTTLLVFPRGGSNMKTYMKFNQRLGTISNIKLLGGGGVWSLNRLKPFCLSWLSWLHVVWQKSHKMEATSRHDHCCSWDATLHL